MQSYLPYHRALSPLRLGFYHQHMWGYSADKPPQVVFTHGLFDGVSQSLKYCSILVALWLFLWVNS
jgi:hypothetical protein